SGRWRTATPPPAAGLRRSRELLEGVVGTAFPTVFTDRDALLIGTGRRTPTPAETAALGELAARLPFPVG
ncbi:maleylpyruvate isomerase N-terminal domain-containing protein, partial [Streptomyces tendae]